MTPHTTVPCEDLLGSLAMQYRRTDDRAMRTKIARQYSDIVERLIQSGSWNESPPPEDQLPYADMPPDYYRYWSGSN